MLLSEVERRTQIRWPLAHSWPEASTPVIAVGPASALPSFAGRFAEEVSTEPSPIGPEGYRIRIKRDGRGEAGLVIGNDARGVLFGVGRLLRVMRMSRQRILIPDDIDIATAPKIPLRGHQLGYRPKTNTYDAWSVPMWEQYFRDLVVFGTNAIELIPPRSDDAPDSPHFPLPPMDMMVEMSRLADEYGLDVWVWYPAMDPDYSDPKTVEFALREWSEVFRKLPRIDAVFVPGGDPGHTRPKVLMALLEKEAEVVHRYHPKAQMWVSPQSFNQEWVDEFLGVLQNLRPAWLGGVVYGPQTRLTIEELRAKMPSQYPLRLYPDITHSMQCQFPVPDWDVAYAVTEGREGINPRPLGEATIFHSFIPSTIGFITYSEGSNDDVNKMVWSALGWDPNADVLDILRDYSRYFIDGRYADEYAQALLALERNWKGPLIANEGVERTLEQFQTMERSASPQDLLNWRFQQGLYRAYYDAYTRRRLLYETELEARALDELRQAKTTGSLPAISRAQAILDRAATRRVAEDLRARVFELAEALFQSIRMQLSVTRYKAISVDRGANLDTIDSPLNNRLWLKQKFDEVRMLPGEVDRVRRLDEIVSWPDPGPGGFYDDLGNVARQPHLIRGPGFDEDPMFLRSALVGFGGRFIDESSSARRISWLDHAESLFDAPLEMRYTSIDAAAAYKIRIVYGGDSPSRKIRLVAGDGIEVHPFIAKPRPVKPVEFDIPAGATHNGELRLRWYREPGLGGNGRGCQVSEVWLIRK